jgi:hypothetical protein
MSQTERAVTREFVRLRHGWGLAADNLRERIGPHLTDLCGIAPTDNNRTIRQKVVTAVRRLITDFAFEDQVAAEIALGATPGTQHRLLGDRVDMVASRLMCSERTARRRIDRAIRRLAEEAMAQRSLTTERADNDPEKGWYVRRFEGLLRLDLPAIEVTETRTIVAMRPNLKKIAIRFSLPPRIDDGQTPRHLAADIAFGARIEAVERFGEGHFRFLLDLPRALTLDESHTYAVVFRLPEGQTMRPHYAMVPLAPVDSFQARIRYDPKNPPELVWRFDHMAPRALSDRQVPGSPLALDDAGEVVQEFERMERGFGYGIAWMMPDGARAEQPVKA